MRKFFIYISIFYLFTTCKKPFTPSSTETDASVLVVEGTIGVGDLVENKFKLGRLNNLLNQDLKSPELNAKVYIVSDNGAQWPLDEDVNGLYKATTSLSVNAKYKIRILTKDGSEYESKLENSVNTPAIDSVTWKQDNDMSLYVHTHDPQNNTRYYRWEYIETYERHSWIESVLEFVNGQVQTRSDQIYACWTNDTSSNILLKSTTALNEDIVSYQSIKSIPRPSDKLSVRYSILVRQFGLTKEAFEFWDVMKKNTELTGTLFDPQPSKLPSNLQCINNKAKKVVGFISVCKIQEERIFIKNSELNYWPVRSEQDDCPVIVNLPLFNINYLNKDNSYVPAYYESITGNLAIAKKYCVDCRVNKGSNIKPAFW